MPALYHAAPLFGTNSATAGPPYVLPGGRESHGLAGTRVHRRSRPARAEVENGAAVFAARARVVSTRRCHVLVEQAVIHERRPDSLTVARAHSGAPHLGMPASAHGSRDTVEHLRRHRLIKQKAPIVRSAGWPCWHGARSVRRPSRDRAGPGPPRATASGRRPDSAATDPPSARSA